MSVWMRRLVVAVTVVALAPTHAYGAMQGSAQVPAGGSSPPPVSVLVEQTGPREVTVTNTGTTRTTFAGTALRGVSRLLKLDPASTCLSARALEPGASCALRQRGAPPATPPVVALRVTVAAGTVSLTNLSEQGLRLGGAASLLRMLGVRGTCAGLKVLPAAGACELTLRAGAPKRPAALAASGELGRGTTRDVTAFALSPTEQKLQSDAVLVGVTLVFIALLPVIVPAVVVLGPPLLLGAAVVSVVSMWLFLVCGSAARCN